MTEHKIKMMAKKMARQLGDYSSNPNWPAEAKAKRDAFWAERREKKEKS